MDVALSAVSKRDGENDDRCTYVAHFIAGRVNQFEVEISEEAYETILQWLDEPEAKRPTR